jgi:hypothetical protein
VWCHKEKIKRRQQVIDTRKKDEENHVKEDVKS